MSDIPQWSDDSGAPKIQVSLDLDNAFRMGSVQSSVAKHGKTRGVIIEFRGFAEN